jgi:hypothetical protein
MPYEGPFSASQSNYSETYCAISVNNRELEACLLRAATDATVVDFQAPSEKQGVGFFCD